MAQLVALGRTQYSSAVPWGSRWCRNHDDVIVARRAKRKALPCICLLVQTAAHSPTFSEIALPSWIAVARLTKTVTAMADIATTADVDNTAAVADVAIAAVVDADMQVAVVVAAVGDRAAAATQAVADAAQDAITCGQVFRWWLQRRRWLITAMRVLHVSEPRRTSRLEPAPPSQHQRVPLRMCPAFLGAYLQTLKELSACRHSAHQQLASLPLKESLYP